jgi:hypothetical protein
MSSDHDEHEPKLPPPTDAIPPIDFTTFVWSLSHSALIHMGVAQGPDGVTTAPDLAYARQNIDLLALLQEKTRGNLTGTEEQLLHQVLLDLRMRFLDVIKKR